LFNDIEHFVNLGCPVLIGVSRKSMIGSILSKGEAIRPEKERVVGGLALALIAAQKGAAIIRTHDVLATCDALEVLAVVS
ncbi:MAG: dihydropteroate synthase, partial [Pseudomonadales bacterium]